MKKAYVMQSFYGNGEPDLRLIRSNDGEIISDRTQACIQAKNGDILDILCGFSPDSVIDKVDADDNETVRSIGNFNVSDYVRYFRDLRSDYFGQIVKNLPNHESRWGAYRAYIAAGESPENFYQNYIGHYDNDQEAIDDLRERGNDADLELIGNIIVKYDGYYFWNND